MEFRILPGNVAYVALTTFGDEKIVPEFDAVFADIEETNALILDIRENHGGNGRIGFDVLAYLAAKPFKTSRWKTRSYRPTFRAQGGPDEWYVGGEEEWSPKGDRLYSRPVVVLTSPRTGSAAEDFAVAFDVMKRGKIIGEPTGGSTGQPLSINLPGGVAAWHGSVRGAIRTPTAKSSLVSVSSPTYLCDQRWRTSSAAGTLCSKRRSRNSRKR